MAYLCVMCVLPPVDLDCGDMPLLTPGSKEMMSQALKATFSGFTKEQQRLGIPKGKKKRKLKTEESGVCDGTLDSVCHASQGHSAV